MINVAIIGCGSIGTTKDDKFDNKEAEDSKTHASSAFKHKKIKLVGVVDLNKELAEKAAKKWKTNSFQFIEQIEEPIDIFIVACNTNSHFMVLNEILHNHKITGKKQPKVVICEKPFCISLVDAMLITEMYKKAGIPIAVNYTRRYSSKLKAVRDGLKDDVFGKIYSCVLAYNRGLLRDGVHGIDFFNWLFGKYEDGKILGDRSCAYDDLKESDLTVPIWMKYERCKNVFMVPIDGRECACFEVTIYTATGKIILDNWCQKFRFYPVEDENTYGNYRSLSNIQSNTGSTHLTSCLKNLLNNVIGWIEGEESLVCSAEDGLEVHKIISKLRNKDEACNCGC